MRSRFGRPRFSNHQTLLQRCLICVSFCIAAHAAAQPRYHAYDLGNLGGGSAVPWSINNQGEIVGSASVAGGAHHPFLYSNGQMLDLGTQGGAYGFGQSINEAGQVVGYFQGANGNTHAFLYSAGVMTDIGVSLGYMSYGYGINDQGQIAGSYYPSSSSSEHAFLYSAGKVTDLGSFGSGWAAAAGINNAGQITGYSQKSFGPARAFIYANGKMTDLGALAGGNSWGTAINERGDVVGYSNISPSDPTAHAFLYSNGHMQDLGSLGGQSLGLGLNNLGDVVGWYTSFDERAFLWTGGSMLDLTSVVENPTGTFFRAAYDINDYGQIAARGQNDHIYLLTPVPEPSAIGLLLLGLGAFYRRRSELPARP